MTPAHEQELWQRYRGAGDLSARDRLVEQNFSLVHCMARRVQRRTQTQYDDLLSAGALGLLQAVERFDPAQGWRLSTFAMQRIRGAMLDHLRQEAGVPRAVLARSRHLALARARVESRLGRRARVAEVARELGVSTDQYHAWDRDGARALVPLSPAVAGSIAGEGPDADRLSWLRAAVERLPGVEQQVVMLSFFEGLSGREISRRLGISDSRVSQLRSRALARLRETVVRAEAV